MPWKIDHYEQDGDTIHVTRVRWESADGRVDQYQLRTAITIPPPGPGHGQGIEELKQTINALRNPPAPPDVSNIETILNAGGG